MTGSITRRRAAALLAAAGGVVAGFPGTAEAACSGKRTFGLFDVSLGQSGALVRSQKRYGKYAVDAFVSTGGAIRVDLYYYGILGLYDLYDAVLEFDGGTEFKMKVQVDKVNKTAKSPYSVMVYWGKSSSPVFYMIRKSRKVKIKIYRRGSRNLALDPSPSIPLTGSSKSMNWAGQQVKACAARQQGSNSGSAPVQGCFLTTACAQTLGLDDDCFELRTLRAFRDGAMASTGRGRELAAAYYELAPAILAALPRQDRDRILRALYGRYILPSVACARLGLRRTAIGIYVRGMLRLLRAYRPDLWAANSERFRALGSPGQA